MKHKVSMFDYLKENYGISKSWLSIQLGVSRSTFQFFEENGFPPETIDRIEEILNNMGNDLKDIKMPSVLKRKEAA